MAPLAMSGVPRSMEAPVPRAIAFKTPQRALATGTATTPLSLDNVNEALQLIRSQPDHYIVASITGRTFVLSASDIVTLPRIKGVKVGDILELDLVHEVGSRDYTLRAQDPALGRRKAGGGKYPLVLVRRANNAAGEDNYAVRVGTEQLLSSQAGEARLFSSTWGAQLVPSGLAHVGAALSPDTVRVQCVVVEHTKGPLERIEKFKRRKGYDKVITHKQPYTRIRVDSITLGQPSTK